ncbi:ThiF family adenylyltransferase [Bradyrhizobium yuanmingense]|uniref:ThiF family adenylyltransferase n=1 Tax=Bradyrhizobium yuanmingense TaxID=108015 RepID=UPI0023BA34B7|nr:ThiF family adenylyltransferase [Bradyrhizobium yuanmingense]MDF0584749.1 ThiF family adenylyltransferase [Bradyrhizobium yuanmingense]
MFQKLVSHNDDIRRLVEKGYAVGFDSNYLIVRDVLYLDEKLERKVGAIVTKLVFTDSDHVVQDDHQIFFAGSHPYNTDGSAIANLGGGTVQLPLSEAAADVVVQRQFSNKPRVDGQLVPFPDFFAKIESYVSIISGPAVARYGGTVLTFRYVEKVADDSVFKVHDTLTSRAEITDLAAKFKNEIVAIIGLGGTGGYLLDYFVKTPVKEIRGFDVDPFHIHNSFRSPGRFEDQDFKRTKAEVYQSRYENFRHGLKLTAKYVDASCAEDMEGVTFAFVCVDKGSSRADIFDLLIAKNIPFIDVGMGLSRKNGPISGMMRATYYSQQDAQQVKDMGLAPLADQPDDVYKTNIQISELNALNAAIAMIRYKQIKGFYLEDDPASFNSLFGLSDCKMIVRSGQNEN